MPIWANTLLFLQTFKGKNQSKFGNKSPILSFLFFLLFREIPPGPPTSNMRGLPGPQVPPRNPPSADGKSSNGSNDRLLSVSGKKKCSHCKEELGKIDLTMIFPCEKNYGVLQVLSYDVLN